MKKHIISIAGDLASGKGTVSKIMADELGYEIYRNGEYFRKLAKEMNMDVTTFNKYVCDHTEIDEKIEKSCAEYAMDRDNLIIDARLGWYAVPESFKVYLQVDINVAAKRAFLDQARKETEKFNTVEEQKEDLINRFKIENERYFQVYGIHKEDLSNYDFIVNTTNLTPEQVSRAIIDEYKKWIDE